MNQKIYILGAGAIGSLVGGALVKVHGRDNVLLVDPDEAQVRAVRDRGLRIFESGRQDPAIETLTVNIAAPEDLDKSVMDRVILATKACSNEAALEGLRRDIDLLVLQNGYDERLDEFGNATRGVEFGFSCQLMEPGSVYNASQGRYVLGRSDCIDQSAAAWAAMLNKAGIPARVSGAIDGWLWSKLLINSALNPVSALAGCSFGELVRSRQWRARFKGLYNEGYPIVRRKVLELDQKLCGFLASPSVLDWVLRRPGLSDLALLAVGRRFSEVVSTMLQDVRRNRPTEIEYINGAIVRLGLRYGMTTPHNDRIRNELSLRSPLVRQSANSGHPEAVAAGWCGQEECGRFDK